MTDTDLKTIQTLIAQCKASGTAAEVILAIVPMVAIIFGTALLFFFILYNYKLRKERIRLQMPTASTMAHLRFISLLAGCVAFTAGIPLTLYFVFTDPRHPGILGGLIPLTAGLGLVAFFYLSKNATENNV